MNVDVGLHCRHPMCHNQHGINQHHVLQRDLLELLVEHQIYLFSFSFQINSSFMFRMYSLKTVISLSLQSMLIFVAYRC